MSSVRMCDRCGRIFPEGEEGSAVGSMTRTVKGDDGRMRTESAQQDACALCASPSAVEPRVRRAPQIENLR